MGDKSKSNAPRFFSAFPAVKRNHMAFVLVAIVVIQGIAWFVGVMLQAHPEALMVVHSQCDNPIQHWDGKMGGIPVWTNWLGREPAHHSLHYRGAVNTTVAVSSNPNFLRKNTNGKGIAATAAATTAGNGNAGAGTLLKKVGQKSVIMWGTHHRSGTYIAQKIFSTICSQMHWCCLFHPTRNSLAAIKDTLLAETQVHLFGHNQWAWTPQDVLGDDVSYRFVHFYRNPVQKIISGYRYHMDGNEAWSRRPRRFSDLCTYSVLYCSSSFLFLFVTRTPTLSLSSVYYCLPTLSDTT
jgi:hypothetical protein